MLLSLLEGKHFGEKNTVELQTLDVRTGKMSPVPSLQVVFGAQWITQDTLVASNDTATKFLTFDFKTQKWSDLVAGNFVDWYLSPDRKYFYFTTGGADPKVQRLRFADRQIETITSLKGLRRVVDSVEKGGVQVNCRARWLANLHPRHRHPGNLRAQRPLALMIVHLTRQCLV